MSDSRTRRQILTALAATAASPLVPIAAWGQPTPTPSPSASVSPSPTPPPDPSSAAEALTDVARIRWGKHLTGEQLGEIAKSIDGRLRAADRMKQVKLTNGDEPDFVYSAAVR